MADISVQDLRRDLKHVIDDVAAGDSVIVTRRGEPMVRIVPVIGQSGDDAALPAFGLWAKRDDLQNPAAWVRERRAPRYPADANLPGE